MGGTIFWSRDCRIFGRGSTGSASGLADICGAGAASRIAGALGRNISHAAAAADINASPITPCRTAALPVPAALPAPDTVPDDAFVLAAARDTMARTVEDVLARRARLLYLDARAAAAAAPRVAALLAPVLGHDAAWQAAQTVSFRALAARHLP